jgi:hypothetical protein
MIKPIRFLQTRLPQMRSLVADLCLAMSDELFFISLYAGLCTAIFTFPGGR